MSYLDCKRASGEPNIPNSIYFQRLRVACIFNISVVNVTRLTSPDKECKYAESSSMNRDSLLPSLQLVICREGDSQTAQSLAEATQNAFRGNIDGKDSYLATISDLPVPIRSFSQCPSDFPPDFFLDQALHTLVVLLVNNEMATEKSWRSWIRKCEKHTASSNQRHHIIALCLSDGLKKSFTLIKNQPKQHYSVKIGYNDLQKNQQMVFGEFAERPAWFALYTLQSCRHLLAKTVFNCSDDKEKLKLKLFISHAKKDSLPLANSLRSALDQKEYFNTWYDTKDLAEVDDWRMAIKEGVNNSVVIVLRTEEYDSRPWCRQEFLWADQCAVPIVCVEARNNLEFIADALAASRVPTVRIPDGNLFRVLFLALKESLRIMQLERRVIQLHQTHVGIKNAKSQFLIPYTPNLLNLTHAAKTIAEKRRKTKGKEKGKYIGYNVVVYTDPPLTTELYQASKSYIEQQCGMTYLLTPTLIPFWNVTATTAKKFPKKLTTPSLLHKSVNISISNQEDDLKRLGLTVNEMNGLTVQLSQALIANEAIVTFGHDWRDDGVMQQVYRFAEEHQDVVLVEKDRRGLIKNYCFWGSTPGLNEREKGHLRGILDIISCERPEDSRLTSFNTLKDVPEELYGYAFARALTNMRRKMTEDGYARACIGGKDMDPHHPEKGPFGRCPGILEEALLSILTDQPLYLSALLGGVTEQIINAVKGDKAGLSFELPSTVVSAWENADIGTKPNMEAKLTRSKLAAIYAYNGPLAPNEILTFFQHYGIKRIAVNNGLSPQENLFLFNASTISEVIGWILTGLARLQFVKIRK